jgi:TolA-binding protein
MEPRNAIAVMGGELDEERVRSSTPLRLGARALALALATPLAACATKQDMKLLRSEVVVLQARQDSLFRQLGVQVMDSLHAGQELMLRVRGDLGHQLLAMEQQLIQIQELTGQGQRQLGELRQQWTARNQEVTTSGAVGGGAGAMSDAEIEQAFALGQQKLQEGAAATARAAFGQIVSSAPTHARAADAQIQVAESYVAEKNYATAYREFERVVELFPNSEKAPAALFRAGVVAGEEGNIERARRYFDRVRTGYPRTDEARLAGQELQKLNRRR